MTYGERVRLLLAAAPDEVDRLGEAVAAATSGEAAPEVVGERWLDLSG